VLKNLGIKEKVQRNLYIVLKNLGIKEKVFLKIKKIDGMEGDRDDKNDELPSSIKGKIANYLCIKWATSFLLAIKKVYLP
jgi:hypothetical protein